MRFGLRNVRPIGALHWSALRLVSPRRGSQLANYVDLLSSLPDDVGMMLNDDVGDCFEAHIYHGDQVRTKAATGTLVTQPDAIVGDCYKLTGWNGTDQGSGTDRGTDPAQLVAAITAAGGFIPYSTSPAPKLVASIEIDPRNMADVVEAIDDCYGIGVGITVPQSLVDALNSGNVPLIWDFHAGDSLTNEGHEIFVGKASAAPDANVGFVSWGNPRYEMTPAFWNGCVNQCTAFVFSDIIEATGKTPLGLTMDQITASMRAIQSGQLS
jgi:hypothetical protein